MPVEHRVSVDPAARSSAEWHCRAGSTWSARTAFPSAGSKRLRPRRCAFGVGAWIRTRASAGRRPAGGAFDRHSGIWNPQARHKKVLMDAVPSSRIWLKDSRGGTLPCRKQSVLRRGNVQARPCPRWESRVCPWRRRPVVRRRTCCRRPWRRRPSDRQSMRSGRTGRGFRSLVSMRKKSPTSAWRRSISLTRTASETPGQA